MPTDPGDDRTQIDPDEADGLLHGHVGTRGELNELEQENIELGMEWATRATLSSRRRRDVLTEDFLYELHRRMFGQVWNWAGRVRRTNKNIGLDWPQVRPAVRDLIQDARLWREHSVYGSDELAVRFHHRLVAIHPFANGNGRHARLMADLVVLQQGQPRFSWGGGRLETTSALRSAYIGALREADSGNIRPLILFARS